MGCANGVYRSAVGCAESSGMSTPRWHISPICMFVSSPLDVHLAVGSVKGQRWSLLETRQYHDKYVLHTLWMPLRNSLSLCCERCNRIMDVS